MRLPRALPPGNAVLFSYSTVQLLAHVFVNSSRTRTKLVNARAHSACLSPCQIDVKQALFQASKPFDLQELVATQQLIGFMLFVMFAAILELGRLISTEPRYV